MGRTSPFGLNPRASFRAFSGDLAGDPGLGLDVDPDVFHAVDLLDDDLVVCPDTRNLHQSLLDLLGEEVHPLF